MVQPVLQSALIYKEMVLSAKSQLYCKLIVKVSKFPQVSFLYENINLHNCEAFALQLHVCKLALELQLHVWMLKRHDWHA